MLTPRAVNTEFNPQQALKLSTLSLASFSVVILPLCLFLFLSKKVPKFLEKHRWGKKTGKEQNPLFLGFTKLSLFTG